MKLELNLWFNRANTNGQVNINAGEELYKFNNLETIDKWINKGIAKGFGDSNTFITLINELGLDIDAKYAWLDHNDFVYWNTTKTYAKVFYNADMFTLQFNKAYQQTTSKYRPHASYYYKGTQ